MQSDYSVSGNHPVNATKKVAEGGSSTWAPVIYMVTRMEFLAPGFCPTQFQCCGHLRSESGDRSFLFRKFIRAQWFLSFSLSLPLFFSLPLSLPVSFSLSNSAFKINKCLKRKYQYQKSDILYDSISNTFLK